MFPYEIFPGVDMYLIMICLSAVAAIFVFRFFADKLGLRAKLQNLCMINAVASIMVGYYSAVLFQAFYNIKARGKFIIDNNTGATFYGGLIGGAACFLAIYFIAGRFIFKEDRKYLGDFWKVADIAAACIAVAHCFGRIGCLMVGCCYGAETDAWYGIYMVALDIKVVPIQLYEALFLLLIFALFVYRILKKQTYNLQLYMILYGVWRFLIEYARDDYRGTSFISFLTPSQLTAVFMVIGAVALIALQKYFMRKIDEKQCKTQE